MSKIDQNHLEILTTEDGSLTVKNLHYNESCHSISGAKEETLLHYIKGCKVDSLLAQEEIKIFEMGFGTGLGFLTTLNYLREKSYTGKLIYYAIEKDIPTIELGKTHYQQLNQIKKDNKYYSLRDNEKDNCFELKVLTEDARAAIKNLESNFFDCLYQDAFSPRRNPELWTVEWFTEMKRIALNQAWMSTYSASSSIRKSMIAAGWKLYAGEKFGTKRTSTRASLQGTTENEILEKLERSPAGALYDKDVDSYRKKLEKRPLLRGLIYFF